MTWLVGTAAVIAALATGAWWRLLRSTPPVEPTLPGTLSSATLYSATDESRARSYYAYTPSDCPRGAPLLLVLHGSHGTAAQMRRYTAYEFERLAERHKFIVVYPEGYRGYWNDVRRVGGYAAKKENVDDVGFLHALVDHYRTAHEVGAVFAMGYSNGGQMCIRLALDAPGVVKAMCLVAACMPTPDNNTSAALDRVLPTMIVNGTEDPINPYNGGKVTIFGFGSRGTVVSSVDSAQYFAAQLGAVAQEGPTEVVPASSPGATRVDRRAWRAERGVEVSLYTVHGGGHVIPQPRYEFFRLAGRTEMRFNTPEECWHFFARVMHT